MLQDNLSHWPAARLHVDQPPRRSVVDVILGAWMRLMTLILAGIMVLFALLITGIGGWFLWQIVLLMIKDVPQTLH